MSDVAAAAVLRGRERAEALMVDACTIAAADVRTDGAPVAGAVRYSGPCRVQEAVLPTAAADQAQQSPAWQSQRKYVSIPVAVTSVRPGDVVTVTSSALDPGAVGHRFRVVASAAKTHLTARRLECEEVAVQPFASDEVTVVTPALFGDAYGNSLPDWGSATRVDVVGSVEPLPGDESPAGRNQSMSRFRVWLPAGTAVSAQSRLEWLGLTLDVDGPPQLHEDSVTPLPVEVTAFRVEG